MLYSLLRGTWRLLPATFRARRIVRRLTQPVAGSFRVHNQEMYSEEYFRSDVDPTATASAGAIAGSVCRDLRPSSVVDVGCGTGALLAVFNASGVRTLGLEYSDSARAIARATGVDAKPFDVRFDRVLPDWGTFDTVCCTEVAEHIPARYADRLVGALIELGGVIVFTAATPGQGGVDHVNEQPHSYWIDKFERQGARLDNGLTQAWREEWRTRSVESWYWKNVMIFRR